MLSTEWALKNYVQISYLSSSDRQRWNFFKYLLDQSLVQYPHGIVEKEISRPMLLKNESTFKVMQTKKQNF